MKMLLITGASGCPEIEADIEPFGFRHFTQQALCMDGEIPEVESLLVGKILHAGCPPVRNGHQVAGGVGIFV